MHHSQRRFKQRSEGVTLTLKSEIVHDMFSLQYSFSLTVIAGDFDCIVTQTIEDISSQAALTACFHNAMNIILEQSSYQEVHEKLSNMVIIAIKGILYDAKTKKTFYQNCIRLSGRTSFQEAMQEAKVSLHLRVQDFIALRHSIDMQPSELGRGILKV